MADRWDPELYDRPTPLEGPLGLRDWVRMFRPAVLDRVEDPERFFRAMEDAARAKLFRDGAWHADYRRLRVAAHRPGAAPSSARFRVGR